jgi:GntR family transcriptional regulator/MocR family aminotransferase
MAPVAIEGSAAWEIPVNNAHCRLAYLTPSNQFPTGISMSAARRLEWLEWARETGAYIVEDDYDGEFRYSSRPLPSLQSQDTAGRVIYVGSFSKLMFPSLRLGYLVLPMNMVPAFWTAKTITALSTSLLQQATLAEFIEQGHFGRHIRRMRILYKERLRVITEALRREVRDELVWTMPEAGMHICVKFLCKADDVAVSSALQAAEIGAMPLSAFYIRRAKAQGLVLGFAGYTPRAIQAAVRKLRQVVKAMAC